ncbi:hypothetical protein [Flavobacterium sp. YO12]|uniref:hypothetical protein n=1 Tax=unclassified Flavobacterium TaxID=196869 RepID=UPI00100BEAF7|nr:hypothetical protein [Flavobacterium sp. YO12]
MKKALAYIIIVFASLMLIEEIIHNFSVLKTGYTIAFCKDGFVKDTLIITESGPATGVGRNTSSNFVYHGFLVSNNKKASLTMNINISTFSYRFKDHRLMVYHSKYTSTNLFYQKPTSFLGLDFKYFLEPFFFLFALFSIIYLIFKRNQ